MSVDKKTVDTKAAVKHEESLFLRSQCNEILKRLFPDSESMGDCSPTDLLLLMTIFYLSRVASLARAPRLLPQTICYAIHKLIRNPPYHYFNNQSAFLDMRRYLTLLAECLRSFRDSVNALPHDVRNQWYHSIT